MLTVGLSRLRILVTALVMAGVAKLERRNPEALLELEKETLRQRLIDYDNGLAAHAGLTERLMTQLRSAEAREAGMVALVEARLAAGERQAAAPAALELKVFRAELDERRQQLAQAETTYRSLLQARQAAIAAAKARIEETRRQIQSMRLERAAADILSMSSGVVLDPTGATFERLHEMVEEERIKARGRIKVARDRHDFGDAVRHEDEQRLLGEDALREFLALQSPQASLAPPHSSEGVDAADNRADPSSQPGSVP